MDYKRNHQKCSWLCESKTNDVMIIKFASSISGYFLQHFFLLDIVTLHMAQNISQVCSLLILSICACVKTSGISLERKLNSQTGFQTECSANIEKRSFYISTHYKWVTIYSVHIINDSVHSNLLIQQISISLYMCINGNIEKKLYICKCAFL